MSADPAVGDVRPGVAIIGAGALGTTLALRLAERGYPILAVLNRSAEGAKRLAETVEAVVYSTHLDDLPDAATLVCCCVPDDALSKVAETLYLLPRNWAGTTVLHTSGVMTTDVLAPLAHRGAQVLSFHPMQTFTHGSPPAVFEDIYVGLEGEAIALEFGSRLAEDLGAQSLRLTPKAKVLYHLAATVASNYFVTLMALTDEVLGEIGLNRPQAAALMRPLVAGTFRNLEGNLPEDVLTGPIARGDLTTVRRHFEALRTCRRGLVPFYAVMAEETVRVALRGGHLSRAQVIDLLDLIHEALLPDV